MKCVSLFFTFPDNSSQTFDEDPGSAQLQFWQFGNPKYPGSHLNSDKCLDLLFKHFFLSWFSQRFGFFWIVESIQIPVASAYSTATNSIKSIHTHTITVEFIADLWFWSLWFTVTSLKTKFVKISDILNSNSLMIQTIDLFLNSINNLYQNRMENWNIHLRMHHTDVAHSWFYNHIDQFQHHICRCLFQSHYIRRLT